LLESFASLADKHRSGAPLKLNVIHRDLIKTWAKEEALTAPAILAKLKEEGEVTVCANTLTQALKKMRFRVEAHSA